METVKANFKKQTNVNPVTGEESTQLIGNATLVDPGSDYLKQTNSEGEVKQFKVAEIQFEANGTIIKRSAGIFEKTLNNNEFNKGDTVAIVASKANGNTYYRVIGKATPNLADASEFESFFESAAEEDSNESTSDESTVDDSVEASA